MKWHVWKHAGIWIARRGREPYYWFPTWCEAMRFVKDVTEVEA